MDKCKTESQEVQSSCFCFHRQLGGRERNCDDAKSTHLLLLTVVRVRLHGGDAARRICGNGRGRHPELTVLAEMLGVGCVHYLWTWKVRR
jgi:hypothetical protein